MKLPIRAGETLGFPSIIDADGVTIASCVNPDALPRIVACVNACEGVTEPLSAMRLLRTIAGFLPPGHDPEDDAETLRSITHRARTILSTLGEGDAALDPTAAFFLKWANRNPDFEAIADPSAAEAILHELAHMDPEEDNVKALAWLIDQARSALGEEAPHALIEKHGADTKLHDIPDHEFNFGGDFDALTKEAGYSETAYRVVNAKGAWGMTVAQFCAEMRKEGTPR